MSAETLSTLIAAWLRFLFLFTPFFAISMFLGYTKDYDPKQRSRLAGTITIAMGVLCFVLFFFGLRIFALFGITLDAFRVGAGALLFLTSVQLISTRIHTDELQAEEGIAVVPLAMPVIIGPATVSAIMVMGADVTNVSERIQGCLALLLAVLSMGLLLVLAEVFERIVGKKGIQILSRITALILAALSAQMILTGVKNFWTGI